MAFENKNTIVENDDLIIRPYQPEDEEAVIDLWFACDLVTASNNPRRDIERKLEVNPEMFLVGILEGKLVATVMGGYEGHRGWVNYLAVAPNLRRLGIGRRMMEAVERLIVTAGAPKINLQVRAVNEEVVAFYESIGYKVEPILNLGKRFEFD